MATAPSWYSASLSSLSELDAHESHAQALTTSAGLHEFESEPSEGPHPQYTSDIPTPPKIVILVMTHAPSGRQNEPVPVMVAQDPPVPVASTIVGMPPTAPSSPESPVDSSTEAPPLATEAPSLFSSANMPPSTLASSMISESSPAGSPLSSLTSPLLSSPTQSTSLASERPANDTITIPVGVFAFLFIAAVGLVASLILGMVCLCTKTRKRKKGGNEQQQAAGTAVVHEEPAPEHTSATGRAASAAGAQTGDTDSEARVPESGQNHIRLSVVGWPKWAIKRVMGAGGDKRHVDFEMLAGKGAGT